MQAIKTLFKILITTTIIVWVALLFQTIPAFSASLNATSTPLLAKTTTSKPMVDQILWNQPYKIAGLKLFQEGITSDKIKYYKVGKILTGKYKNGSIILVITPNERLDFPETWRRFIKQNNKIILLSKYSDELFDGDGLIRTKFTIDANYDIPVLNYPDVIKGPRPRQILEIDKYARGFFNFNKIKKVFTHPTWGQVYTTSGYPSSRVEVFERYGFYLRAPDGTVKVYSLKVDFIGKDNVPAITWKDGTKNINEYTFTERFGCGSETYASIISPKVINLTRDLKPTGKNSKGDIIYELKNTQHSLLKNLYDNEYWVPENQQKMPYEKFISEHPMFFWIDPFGRLIKFQNAQFIPAAECGKPVIYLYPEKTIKVSVQIEPKGGIKYTEPKYNNGWEVLANPQGKLIELSSGKSYPYLFWEGWGGIYQQPKKGFVITREQVSDFLTQELTQLGLNQKETTDFLEFWQPKMQSAPYYFITFLGNQTMNQIAPLKIEPKPDTVIRILMDFTPLDKPIEVEGYQINTPTRHGFTVVEWGGVIK